MKVRLKTYVPLLMKESNLWCDIYKNKGEQILEFLRRNEEESK